MASPQTPASAFCPRSNFNTTTTTTTTAAAAAAATAKLTKSRGRTVVRPILKKLHSHSLSDRESLDLDRGWDDQPSSPRFGSPDHGSHRHDSDASGSFYHYYHGTPASPRSPRDVSFSLSPSDLGTAAAAAAVGGRSAIAPGGPGGGSGYKFSHARSTSGASHASIATSNSAGARNGGSFVHPFQQTPQTSALPLSYANARASLDNASGIGPRDYSPTITEDGDDLEPCPSLRPSVSASASASATAPASAPVSAGALQHRRPSDGPRALRLTASRSNSANQSRSELQPSPGTSVVDSPLTPPPPAATASSTPATATAAPSCSSSTGPMSPLRNSLDMGGFRLRSRSEVDTATRQEHVREARRKFEARERAKEEKYAREQMRKRERADSKEAQRLEREQARIRKESHTSLSSATHSSGPHRRRGARGSGSGQTNEKAVFSGGYSLHSPQEPQPRAEDVEFKSRRRTKMAKQKTLGVWTAFMLWLRTRLLKLGRR